jgi:photosystem II stability/assembly factor-like uncharacterized protein
MLWVVLGGASLVAAQDVGESQAIRARIRDYLARHGDNGRIDAENQRRRVGAEYERFRREADLRKRGLLRRGVENAEWISLGPNNAGGRMTAIAPIPGAPDGALAGAAGGGVWKTTDGGTSWTPLTEGLHDLAVGAMAVAPSNPLVIYVGTGEGGYGSSFIPGIGLVRSLDGGATWILPESVMATSFYRISVHPADANELVAATSGGAFRSTDGGATWVNVVTAADYGEVADLVRDPTDPKVLYATTWCARRGCRFQSAQVLKSSDGGLSWADRSQGLPTGGRGLIERTAIAIAPSDPRVLYAARAVRDNSTGREMSHIYRTTDSGATWVDLAGLAADENTRFYLGDQSFYDNVLVVSPVDPDDLVAGGVSYVRTTDGGQTFSTTLGHLHPDCHDLRYQGSRLWIANDGGMGTSDDGGVTGVERNGGLVTRQFYALAIDPSNRDRVIAGSQDNGTVQSLDGGGAWRVILGADGFDCIVHPLSPEMAWVTYQGGNILLTRFAGSPGPPRLENASPALEEEDSQPFHTIVRLDPRDPNTLYTGTLRVWTSRDRGETWRPLPTKTSDGSPWSDLEEVRAIAVPPFESPLLLIGKGLSIYRSEDRGETWSRCEGLPVDTVTNIEFAPGEPGRVYATFARTSGPSVYRSDDAGRTWIASADGLPVLPAQVVRVDPTDSTNVFCGTDGGIFRSTDRGVTWTRFGTGLPAASVHDLQISKDGAIVRAATYGRGIWELDVPPAGNSAPTVRIAAPGSTLTIRAGSALDFAGQATDPDPGDDVAGTWFFPDDGSAVTLEPGGNTTRHTFRRGGEFPVALTVRDTRGATASATQMIRVQEMADSCGTPIVIPSRGPFPYTLSWNDTAGSTEPSDPDPPCFPFWDHAGSTWLEFTPEADGDYTFLTCTDHNNVMSIFTGPACGPYQPAPLSCEPIRSGECGFGTTEVTLSVRGGETLRIQLGGAEDTELGPIRLTVSAGTATGLLRVDGIDRREAPAAGGILVVIDGRGFRAGATVSFGGTPASAVAVLGSTALTATVPPHAAGLVDVAITVPGAGTAVLGQAFLYQSAQPADRSVVNPVDAAPRTTAVIPR